MLITITGVPGHGKSLYGVQLLSNYIDENIKNQALHDKGIYEQNGLVVPDPRPLYTDIDGLKLEGWEVLEAPEDWRECPDGSVVIYDEAQKRFGPDGQGRSSRGDIQEFETHRHRGFDIVLITQHPKLLHAHIRRLIGRHYHVFRMHGSNTAKIFQRDGQMDIDKPTALEKQDSFMWSYNKDLFDKYKSATLHTHKKEMPHWFKRTVIGMVLGTILLLVTAYFTISYFKGKYFDEPKEIKLSSTSKEVVTTEKPITIKPDTTPVACISSNEKCVCYDKDGYLIDQFYYQCLENTTGTLSFINLKPNVERRAAASADG